MALLLRWFGSGFCEIREIWIWAGCGWFGFLVLVLIGAGGLDLVIWIGLCWLGLSGSWIGFDDR